MVPSTLGRAGAEAPPGRTILFVLPTLLDRQRRPVAGLINAGQLAKAAQHTVGSGLISVTPTTGWLTPEEAIWSGSRPDRSADEPLGSGAPRPWLRGTARFLRQPVKDCRRIFWNLRGRSAPPPGSRPLMVWQRLDPFLIAGVRLAQRYAVPLVVSVHSLTVMERRRWGVGRSALDPLLTAGERWVLEEADCVCVVSRELIADLAAAGIDLAEKEIIVTPNQVDVDLFRPRRAEALARREELGISPEEVVIGWAGSFRGFHRLDQLLEIARRLQERSRARSLCYLLLGEGRERQQLTVQLAAAGIRAILPGVVDYARVPEYLSAMDVGLVLGGEERGRFHYSPMKLREFLACGVPVVGSKLGDISNLLSGTPLEDLLGETVEELAGSIDLLARNDALRVSLRAEARGVVEREEGWVGQMRRVLRATGLQIERFAQP